MRQILPDVWITEPELPFPESLPELKFHGFLVKRDDGNLLFNRAQHGADQDAIAGLGGVARHYIAHGHEAGPGLAAIKRRFGSTLLAHGAAEGDVSRHTGIDRVLEGGERFADGVEVIATPGHTPSNVAFKLSAAGGETYLFVGDTIFPEHGKWEALVFPNEGGDKAQLERSLAELARHEPDVVFFSATLPDEGFHRFTPAGWRAALDEAAKSLS